MTLSKRYCILAKKTKVMDAKFTKNITDQINQYSCIEYGCIGTKYLCILTIQDGKIITIGEFLYRCWREFSEQETVLLLLQQLGMEAQKYLDGERESVPRVCYSENVLKCF